MCLSTRNIENMKGKKKMTRIATDKISQNIFGCCKKRQFHDDIIVDQLGEVIFFQDAEKVRLQWRSQLALEWKVGKLQRRRFTVGPEVQQNVEDRLKDCGKNFGFGRSPRCLILRPC
jgi:hypothetical protein